MGETTKIEWTATTLPDGRIIPGATFNPWIGCSRVHEGCRFCYAEADMDKRRGRVKWGPNGTRSVTSEEYWRKPLKWNAAAEKEGVRRRVFCASLADVFEDWQGAIVDHHGRRLYVERADPLGSYILETPQGSFRNCRPLTMNDLRARLFALIDATPHLDWLLVTKRPQNVRRMWAVKRDMQPIFPGMPGPLGQPTPCVVTGAFRKNVWLLTSVSDQATYDAAAPHLEAWGDLVPVIGYSGEPLLGPITLGGGRCDWVIVGGESGHNARPCRPEWIRSIVGQCKAASVACFVKQFGANIVTRNDQVEDEFNGLNNGWPDPHVEYDIHGFRENYQGADCRIRLRDPKGGDWNEWPEDIRVREWPKV